MSDQNRFVDEKILNSITSGDYDNPIDSSNPLSFLKWVERERSSFTTANEYITRYNSYVNNWYEAKNIIPEKQENIIVDLYKSLVKEIVLSYTSINERRFLRNLDLNNSTDLAIAIPFFAQKIKDICLYFSTLREKAKNATIEYNLKGSNYGIQKLIYNEIAKALETQDLTDLIRTYNLSISSIRNNLIVELEELFDLYPNYFDLGTLPASAYGSLSGIRSDYFDLNVFQIDPDLYLNFDKSIIKAISSYPFFLTELGTNNFSVVPEISATQLEYLKDIDFISLVNNNNQNNLKINLNTLFNKKFIGTDFYYLSTNKTNTSVVSGKLFDADSRFANYLNKLNPTLAYIPEPQYLKTAKNIGLFFKPDKIGFLNFFNFDFFNTLNKNSLSADTIYIFPDPTKFGNITGNTQQYRDIPLASIENNSILQSDFSNSFKFGDIKSDTLLPTFRSYQTREQSLDDSYTGITRYVDPQEFFTGPEKNTWANEDVFPVVPSNRYPMESRTLTLLPTLKTLVQYKSDVFGNEFGLYKLVEPYVNLQAILSAAGLEEGDRQCLLLDGHLFYDPISGYNFNYQLSGTILKTSNAIPPGSGYYTRTDNLTVISPLSANLYNNGIPQFALSGNPFSIVSYRYQPELFCDNIVDTYLNCNIRDGFTFTSSNSGLLKDYSTDDPNFNPLIPVYFDELVDGGSNPSAPNFRASFAFPSLFSFAPPLSVIKDYFCSYYVVSAFTDSFTPCSDAVDVDEGLTENNFFVNIRVPNRTTSYLQTLTGGVDKKQSIYKTRFENTGDFYYRKSNSTLVMPVSVALSGLLVKYPEDVYNEITNSVVNFDIFYDTLLIETVNYLLFDKIEFNYESNNILSSANNESYIKRGEYKKFEKVSTTWFNENENIILFAKTNLFYQLSTTNFKIVYPTIYVLDLKDTIIKQIYPNKSDLTYSDLKEFSLSGTNLNVEIVEIDKPIFSYSSETDTFNISYLAKDTSNIFYLFETRFKYYNGTLSNISTTVFKPALDAVYTNFANPTSYNNYLTYTVIGSSVGNIINNEFIFGA